MAYNQWSMDLLENQVFGGDFNSCTFEDDSLYVDMAESNVCNYYQRDNEAFQSKSVENWTGDDCFEWALATCNRKFHPCSDSFLNVFKLVNGKELMGFNEEDFSKLVDMRNGPFLYDNFQKLLKQRNENIHTDSHTPSYTTLRNMSAPQYNQSEGDFSDTSCLDFTDYRTVLETSFDENSLFEPFEDFNTLSECPMDGNSTLDCSQRLENRFEFQNSFQDRNNGEFNLDNLTLQDQSMPNYSSGIPYSESPTQNLLNYQQESIYNGELEPEVQGSDDLLTSEDDPVTSRHWFEKMPAGGTRKNRIRSPKCWEFVLRLLQDSRTNGVLVKWEDRENGIFRLLQKETIAQMWGNRTQPSKKPYTYESFSRLLRHHYKKDTLVPVREKQMVYKFGPKVLQSI